MPLTYKRKNKLWSWLVLAGMVLTVTLNYLATTLPLFGRSTAEISDGLPNLFVPAGITFSVWGVIYLGLMLFTAYQLLLVKKKPELPPLWLQRIVPYVLLTHLANSLWIIAWHALWYVPSLLLMVVLFASLIRINLYLGWSDEQYGRLTYVLAVVPFSLYAGWITVALPANITAVFVAYGFTDLVLGPVIWAAAISAVAAMLGILAVLVCRDVAYSLVIAWALFGIALKRSADEPFLTGWAAALCFALLLLIALTVARKIYRLYYKKFWA